MKNLILLLSSVLLFSTACDKNPEAPVKTKKDILSSGKWLLLSLDAKTQVPGQPTDNDLYKDLQSCEKDNLFIFNTNGTAAIDEGPSKCSDTSAQTVSTGNWQLLDNDKKLKLRVILGIFNFEAVTDIVELNDNTMTLKFDTTILYPTTVTSTFTHVKQ
jgi:hypothetical protein